MARFVENVLFGLAFGIGFALAQAVIAFLVSLLSRAHFS